MEIKQKNNISTRFKGIYELTGKVQQNTLLNRGVIDIGGTAIPQALMSNNKDEGIERFTMSSLYFFMSIVTPFFMLPFFNKRFLSSEGLVKNLKTVEKEIMHVSKRYLTKDGKYLSEGIQKTALQLDAAKLVKDAKKKNIKLDLSSEMLRLKQKGIKLEYQKAFDAILERYKGNENELRKKLINIHKKVFTADFLTTAWMWCATPYIVTGITELRTHKKGFSAAFNMVDQSNIDDEKYKSAKRKKLLSSALIATIPPLIAPKLIMKSITSSNGFLNKYASLFNYNEGMFMSKTIFALMWILCDYPSQLISSRDKYEARDRAIRSGALFIMYFGGDFVLNNIFGRAIDKAAGTKIMDKKSGKENFFKNFKLAPRKFSELGNINASSDIIAKTKKYGTGLYWFSLLANCALIGFALPAIMNRMLKNSIQKDTSPEISLDKGIYKNFGF